GWWEALTSELLPMPLAPHRRALLAGRPLANRRVFSIRISRVWSMPRRSSISTRLTLETGSSRRRGAFQMKAEAEVRSWAGGGAGASLSRAEAIRRKLAANSSFGRSFGMTPVNKPRGSREQGDGAHGWTAKTGGPLGFPLLVAMAGFGAIYP